LPKGFRYYLFNDSGSYIGADFLHSLLFISILSSANYESFSTPRSKHAHEFIYWIGKACILLLCLSLLCWCQATRHRHLCHSSTQRCPARVQAACFPRTRLMPPVTSTVYLANAAFRRFLCSSISNRLRRKLVSGCRSTSRGNCSVIVVSCS
jgi:hypothetical protein